MPRRAWSWCLLIALAGFAVPARADFVISIGSASIPQGGTGTVDVFLSSTASSSSPDLLNNLGFTLQITGPHELQFASTQDFSYLNSSQYVFSGDSADQNTSSPGGNVTTTSYTSDTFVGSDSTFSGNPVSLTASSGQVLLASLSFERGDHERGRYVHDQPRPAHGRWLDELEHVNVLRRFQFLDWHRDLGRPLHQHAGDGDDRDLRHSRAGHDRLRPERGPDPGGCLRRAPSPIGDGSMTSVDIMLATWAGEPGGMIRR